MLTTELDRLSEKDAGIMTGVGVFIFILGCFMKFKNYTNVIILPTILSGLNLIITGLILIIIGSFVLDDKLSPKSPSPSQQPIQPTAASLQLDVGATGMIEAMKSMKVPLTCDSLKSAYNSAISSNDGISLDTKKELFKRIALKLELNCSF